MPRLAPLPREAVTDLGDILRASESRMGFLPNSQLIMAQRPEILRAFAQLGAAINGPSSTIDPQLRNMVSQMASRAAGCGYCMAHTAHTATRVGIPAERRRRSGNTRRAPCSPPLSAPRCASPRGPRRCPMRSPTRISPN
jgi:alkylhydroperoxidase family enzyme